MDQPVADNSLPKWVDPLNRLIGIALLLTGGFFTAIIAQTGAFSRYYPFTIYLILNGGIILATYLPALKSKQAPVLLALLRLLFSISLIGMGIINLALVAKAIISYEIGSSWLILLGLASLAPNFIVGFTSLAPTEQSAEEEAHPNNSPRPDQRITPWRIFASHAQLAFIFCIYWGCVIALFGLGVQVFYILEHILFLDGHLSWDGLRLLLPEFILIIAPSVIAITVVLGSLYIGLGVWAAGRHALAMRKNPEFDRMLSQKELDYIEDSRAKTKTYLEAQKYPTGFSTAHYLGGFFGMFLSIGAISAPAYIIAKTFGDAAYFTRTSGDIVYDYQGHGWGGAIFGVIAGLAVFTALFQWLGTRYPEFGVYILRQNKNSSVTDPLEKDNFAEKISHFIRTEQLKPYVAFDPKSFLIMIARQYERAIYATALIFLGLTVVFTYLDIRSYRILGEHGIQYSPYFSLRTQHVPYTDIETIQLSCYTYQEDSRTRLSLAYTLDLPTGKKIGLFDSNISQQELDIALQIDGELDPAHIRFERQESHGLPFAKKSSFQDNCETLVRAKYKAEKAAHLIKLLRLQP